MFKWSQILPRPFEHHLNTTFIQYLGHTFWEGPKPFKHHFLDIAIYLGGRWGIAVYRNRETALQSLQSLGVPTQARKPQPHSAESAGQS